MLAYAKAHKGFAEIESRSAGLSPKLRRLLILIDGQRTTEMLRATLGFDGIENMLDELTDGGFIHEVELLDSATGAAQAGPEGDALGNLPDTRSPDELEKAKNFIINTLVHFHGQYTKMDLMRAVKACETHTALRELYADWLRCMNESRQATRRLAELNEQLLAVI